MIDNDSVISFQTEIIPDINNIGGKAISLIRLTSNNFNVPPGIILTSNFFNEWMNLIKTSSNWEKLTSEIKDKNKTENNLNDLIIFAKSKLKLNEKQKNIINTKLKEVFDNYKNEIYAVRSSSSEEDLKEASFAGGYETKLGVTYDNLEKNILNVFSSVFNYRLLKYKMEKNLNYLNFQIAIIIMKQIKCDSAGVAFSLNIKNNDYDEAIINSNFGIGETVVNGSISPDYFVVNKITKNIIEKKIGKKEKNISININKNNDCLLKENDNINNKDKYSLNDDEIQLIIDNLIKIENLYKLPIDIEFGLENNVLYIFQARPITTYNKLPEEFVTKPNEPRFLYFDETLGFQGLEKNLSILGAEIFYFKMRYDITSNPYHPDPKTANLFSYYGRSLQNISNLLITISKENFIQKIGMVNSFVRDVILKYGDQYLNKNVYKITALYANAKNIFSLYWWGNLKALINPSKYKEQILQSYKDDFNKLVSKVKVYCEDALNGKYSFKYLTETIFYDYGCFFTYNELTILFSIGKGFQKIVELFTPYFEKNPEIKKKVFDISKCYINYTNIIGIELFKLSRLFDNEIYKNKSYEQFLKEYKDKKFSEQFYSDFNLFMEKYGCRCEEEIDIKNLRFSEDPEKVIRLIHDLIIHYDMNAITPMEIFEEAEKMRPIIHQDLLNFAKENKFEKEFEEAFIYSNMFYKEKETGKYYFLQILLILKNCLNKIYENKLQNSGLFEEKDEIYNLTIYQLSDIIEYPQNFDREKVKEIMNDNLNKSNVIGNWKNRPIFFDSRGRMFYPERKVNISENEISGEGVSNGIIRGRAVIMNSPNEKKINKNEILVAKATYPGWIVTIMNCGGLILEVGGTLQHGALICREFNKPCIVNITDATKIIKDGDLLELDANNGIIKFIKE